MFIKFYDIEIFEHRVIHKKKELAKIKMC